jgi:hypothetical protein
VDGALDLTHALGIQGAQLLGKERTSERDDAVEVHDATSGHAVTAAEGNLGIQAPNGARDLGYRHLVTVITDDRVWSVRFRSVSICAAS